MPTTTNPSRSTDVTTELPLRLQGRVLVAEDYPPNQMVAEFFLEKLGLEVDLAVDGREALAALSVGGYDVVLLDVVMPEVDGLEVARRVRAGQVPGCPSDICLIATTTHSSEQDREECFAAGVNEFLNKPFDLEELAAYIHPWLQGNTPAPTASSAGETPPPPGKEIDEPLFDYPGLLASLRENKPLFASYVSGFIEHSTEEMDKIRAALEAQDCLTVRHVAHNWTGACGYLRAQPLLRAIQTLAVAARAEDCASAQKAWPAVEREMFLLHGALRQARSMT